MDSPLTRGIAQQMSFLSFITLHLILSIPLLIAAAEESFQTSRLHDVLDKYLSGEHAALADATPLTGGLSSQVYLVHTPSQHFVVRFLDEQASLPDTLKELWLSTLASEKGISPKVLHVDLANRALILDYIHQEEQPDAPSRLADLLRRQHQPLEMEPFASIHAMRSSIVSALFPQPREAEDLWQELLRLQQLCRQGDVSICHNDLHGLNVLYDGTNYYMIDWTSGGLGVPEFDVVKLTAHWPEELKEAFYENYYGHTPTAEERRRIEAMYTVRLAIIFFNRWHRLMSLTKTEEARRRIADRLAEGWQAQPLRHYLDCPCDGDAEDLFQGSLSALLEFLQVSEIQK